MSLLWIEKYRPQKMSDIKSQDNIVKSIEKFLLNKNLPHLLFFGYSGTGKTSCIHCACKKLYGKNYKYMILELNASDNRGIDTVRKQIYEFANTKSMINNGIKTIILDEADSMTIMAQNALRKLLEKNSNNVRFCIICNYINKIIPALKSRCIQFRFSPLKDESKMIILKNIKKAEIRKKLKNKLIESQQDNMVMSQELDNKEETNRLLMERLNNLLVANFQLQQKVEKERKKGVWKKIVDLLFN